MGEVVVTKEQIRWFRLKRSGLIEPFDSVQEASESLMGIQAQILPAAGVSLWNRTSNLHTYNQLLDTLFEDRTLVKLWGQRGTLHLYATEDWPLVYSGFTDRPSYYERKTVRKGGSREEYRNTVNQLAQLLEEKKRLTRKDLRESSLPLNDMLLSSWGGIFYELVRGGHACHGPGKDGEGSFESRSSWLPDLEWSPVPVMDAHLEWTHRYIRGYGPASLGDLAYWRGVPMRDVKKWLASLQEPLVTVWSEDDEELYIHEDDLDELLEEPPAKRDWPLLMLYRFDPLLLGHPDKSWLIDRKHKPKVWRKAGHIEGTIVKHGRLQASWRYKRQAGSFSIVVEPFTKLTQRELKFAERQGKKLADFFEGEWGGMEIAD